MSIHYSRATPPPPPSSSHSNNHPSSSKTASVVSKSGNITLKTKANNGNKENTSANDFPSLGPASKSLGDTFRSANSFSSASGSTSFNSRNTGSNNTTGSTKFTNAKAKDTRLNDNSKKLCKEDFPSLSSGSSDHPMKNFLGVSKVTVPVNNNWSKTSQQVPKSQTATKTQFTLVENTTSKNRKKKAALPPGTLSFNSHPNSGGKKRPLRLGNVFEDNIDDNRETYGLGDAALFTSVAPESSSNIKIMASDSKKTSELKIGSLKTPVLKSVGDFPSLGGKKKNGSVAAVESWGPSLSGKKTSKTAPSAKSNFANTDMTFHTSYGETFAVSPTEETNGSSTNSKNSTKSSSQKSKKEKVSKLVYEFNHPPNFEKRNQQLIKTISEQCGGETDKFRQ